MMGRSILEVYFFRHAESHMNMRPHLISGRNNATPLTRRGREQARLLGHHLSAHKIVPSLAFSSPAARAVQTATTTLLEMGLNKLPIITDDALQEMSQGKWVGRVRSEIYTEATLAELERLGKDFKAPGGESMNEVGARMLAWLHDNASFGSPTGKSQCIFVFTHGVAIRCLASTLRNWTQSETYQAVIANTSISLFAYEDSKWCMKYLGKKPET